MSDLISVIIPVYLVEQYLQRCINSVLSQTYDNLEIILVDDGSPDKCGEICDSYEKEDSRIRVIHKKNGGLSDARNAALDICKGEYICFVDSDDYVSNDFVESLYSAAKAFDSKLSICGIVKFDEYGNSIVDYAPSNYEKAASSYEMTETVWRPAACNKMYHRSLFEGIRYPYGKLYEDLYIYHDILERVDHISFTGKNSYYYFNRQSSIMNKKYDIRNTDEIEGLDLRIKKLREMGYGKLADQQLIFVFEHTVEAFEKLDNKINVEKERKKEVKTICDRHFNEMMRYTGFTKTQKARIALFRLFPSLYTRVFKTGF